MLAVSPSNARVEAKQIGMSKAKYGVHPGAASEQSITQSARKAHNHDLSVRCVTCAEFSTYSVDRSDSEEKLIQNTCGKNVPHSPRCLTGINE